MSSNSITPKLLKEYAIDFETGEPLLDANNKFIIIDGIEAVKVRCWLALKIQRNRFAMYMDVGNNLKSLLGKDMAYVNKNIQAILEEALIDKEYVTAIKDTAVTKNENTMIVEFTVVNIYGSYDEQITY